MIKKSSITVLVGIALVGVIFVGAAETTPKCPRVVVRAAFDDPTMVSEVTRWADPWEINRAESYLVVEVSEREILRLETAGFRVEVDQELTDMMCAPRRPIAHQKAGIAGLPCYRTVDETFADVENLISRYPSLTEWIDIGDSWEVHSGWEPGFEGDDLMVLKLGNKQTAGVGTPAAPDTKPILFVQAEDAHGNLGPVSAEFFWVIGSDGGTRQAAGRVAP